MVKNCALYDFFDDAKKKQLISSENCPTHETFLEITSEIWFHDVDIHRSTDGYEMECFWFINMGKFAGKGRIQLNISGYRVSILPAIFISNNS